MPLLLKANIPVEAVTAEDSNTIGLLKGFFQKEVFGPASVEAKQNLMKSQSDELQAKYDYLFRTKILDFYKGEPIE